MKPKFPPKELSEEQLKYFTIFDTWLANLHIDTTKEWWKMSTRRAIEVLDMKGRRRELPLPQHLSGLPDPVHVQARDEPPAMEEVATNLKAQKPNRAQGPDQVSNEDLKTTGAQRLHPLYQAIWAEGRIPERTTGTGSWRLSRRGQAR